MNNIFRPISLSEGVIHEKKDILLRKFSKNDLTDIYIKIDEDDERFSSSIRTPNSPDTHSLVYHSPSLIKPLYIDNNNTLVIDSPNNYQELDVDNENNNLINIINKSQKKYSLYEKIIYYLKKLIPSKNIMIYVLKKLFMFMFHLTLISIFEIIFFFFIVSFFENKGIIGIINNFFNQVPGICNNMNFYQKEYFTNVFNSIVNATVVNENSIIASTSRIIFNNKLFINAWIYFLIIIGIDFLLLIIKICYKIKINFKKIILENIAMIVILGIYEYLFFKSIILLYKNISQDELMKLIMEEFTNCLIL
jgi:hypothetical protein